VDDVHAARRQEARLCARYRPTDKRRFPLIRATETGWWKGGSSKTGIDTCGDRREDETCRCDRIGIKRALQRVYNARPKGVKTAFESDL